MEIDLPRQRIGLSMRLDDEPGQTRSRPAAADSAGPARPKGNDARSAPRGGNGPVKPSPAPASGAFADAFAKARKD